MTFLCELHFLNVGLMHFTHIRFVHTTESLNIHQFYSFFMLFFHAFFFMQLFFFFVSRQKYFENRSNSIFTKTFGSPVRSSTHAKIISASPIFSLLYENPRPIYPRVLAVTRNTISLPLFFQSKTNNGNGSRFSVRNHFECWSPCEIWWLWTWFADTGSNWIHNTSTNGIPHTINQRIIKLLHIFFFQQKKMKKKIHWYLQRIWIHNTSF